VAGAMLSSSWSLMDEVDRSTRCYLTILRPLKRRSGYCTVCTVLLLDLPTCEHTCFVFRCVAYLTFLRKLLLDTVYHFLDASTCLLLASSASLLVVSLQRVEFEVHSF